MLLFLHTIYVYLILYNYKGGSKMFWCRFRKIIAGILMGFGVGVLLVLFLPPVAWICIMGIGMLIGGIKFLFSK